MAVLQHERPDPAQGQTSSSLDVYAVGLSPISPGGYSPLLTKKGGRPTIPSYGGSRFHVAKVVKKTRMVVVLAIANRASRAFRYPPCACTAPMVVEGMDSPSSLGDKAPPTREAHLVIVDRLPVSCVS